MTRKQQRLAWTVAMAALPFIVVAFAYLTVDVTQWDRAVRLFTASFSAALAVIAFTFPGYRGHA